jgi:hypothetical protein
MLGWLLPELLSFQVRKIFDLPWRARQTIAFVPAICA